MVELKLKDALEEFKKAELNEETDADSWEVPEYARINFRRRPIKEQMKEVRDELIALNKRSRDEAKEVGEVIRELNALKKEVRKDSDKSV